MVARQITNSRQLELEQRLLEARLKQQQLQSDEDSRWLHREETNLKKRLSNSGSFGSADSSSSENPTAAANINGVLCANTSLGNDQSAGKNNPSAGYSQSVFDKDRSSTPNSSGSTSSRTTASDEKSIVVKGKVIHLSIL